jgi:hypothetical protein
LNELRSVIGIGENVALKDGGIVGQVANDILKQLRHLEGKPIAVGWPGSKLIGCTVAQSLPIYGLPIHRVDWNKQVLHPNQSPLNGIVLHRASRNALVGIELHIAQVNQATKVQAIVAVLNDLAGNLFA